MEFDLRPLFITIKVALWATLLSFFLGIAIAYAVVRIKRGKAVIDTIMTLPLVLPPTVVGFFLLLLFGRNSFIGSFLYSIDMSVVFSWKGAVIASVVVAVPLMYRTVRGAFELVDINIIYSARTLGISEFKIFYGILLPVSLPGVIAGVVLSFARAMGEFGATIMLAGNIPGKTQTMAIAVYSAVLAGDRTLAFQWVGIICSISLLMIILLNSWSAWQAKIKGGSVQ